MNKLNDDITRDITDILTVMDKGITSDRIKSVELHGDNEWVFETVSGLTYIGLNDTNDNDQVFLVDVHHKVQMYQDSQEVDVIRISHKHRDLIVKEKGQGNILFRDVMDSIMNAPGDSVSLYNVSPFIIDGHRMDGVEFPENLVYGDSLFHLVSLSVIIDSVHTGYLLLGGEDNPDPVSELMYNSEHNVVFNPEGSSRMVRICDEKNMRVISSYDKRFQVYPFRG